MAAIAAIAEEWNVKDRPYPNALATPGFHVGPIHHKILIQHLPVPWAASLWGWQYCDGQKSCTFSTEFLCGAILEVDCVYHLQSWPPSLRWVTENPRNLCAKLLTSTVSERDSSWAEGNIILYPSDDIIHNKRPAKLKGIDNKLFPNKGPFTARFSSFFVFKICYLWQIWLICSSISHNFCLWDCIVWTDDCNFPLNSSRFCQRNNPLRHKLFLKITVSDWYGLYSKWKLLLLVQR